MEDAVRVILRGSEQLKVTLDAYAASVPRNDSASALGDLNERDKRVIALISHQDFGEDEQGGLLVLKPPTGSTLGPGVMSVEHVYPILGQFSIRMAQERQQTIDLGSPSALNQPRTRTCHLESVKIICRTFNHLIY
jgi:inositol polyphosphate 5-phosphatase INPP5B/F